MSRPLPSAAFLDRDGTIIEDPGFPNDPAQVRLLPGAGAALARLNAAGVPVIVVTNQSGIARGLVTWDQYRAVKERMEELLALEGARVDATYVCPHYPPVSGPCDCRKPGLRLFEEAATAHRIDLRQAAWLGDRLSDVEPAKEFGGRGLLVRAAEAGEAQAGVERGGLETVPDLVAAVSKLLDGV